MMEQFDSRRVCEVVEHVANQDPSPSQVSIAASEVYAIVLARIGGDTELLGELSQLFIDDVPNYLEKIRAAIDASDAAALRRAAHTFKGAASNFEATAVVDAARQLEEMGKQNELSDQERLWKILSHETTCLLATLRHYIEEPPPSPGADEPSPFKAS